MGRIKKAEGETPEEAHKRRVLEKVANHANRSEKTSWQRKYKNMQAVYNELKPVEDEILDLLNQKQRMLDDITAMRQVMVDECIHPYELLILNEDHIECKFCNKKLSVPNVET
jgi:small-conductance mechanosensitive channel